MYKKLEKSNVIFKKLFVSKNFGIAMAPVSPPHSVAPFLWECNRIEYTIRRKEKFEKNGR